MKSPLVIAAEAAAKRAADKYVSRDGAPRPSRVVRSAPGDDESPDYRPGLAAPVVTLARYLVQARRMRPKDGEVLNHTAILALADLSGVSFEGLVAAAKRVDEAAARRKARKK